MSLTPADAYAAPDDDLLTPDEPEAAGPGLLVRCGAELFGTFLLVFAGVGVLLYQRLDSTLGGLAVALAFGLAALAGYAAVGRVSGGHLNPAVSLGAAVAGRLSWADLLPYWLAQLVGGALASAVLFLTVPTGLGELFGGTSDKRELISVTSNGFGEHSPLAHLLANNNIPSDVAFSLTSALLVEAIATAVLVGVFLAVTRRKDASAPFVVGLTLATLVLVTLPITNAGLNPARSTATAILSETWALQELWLFWVAPLLGAAVAALLYQAFSPSPAADGVADDLTDDSAEYDEPGALAAPATASAGATAAAAAPAAAAPDTPADTTPAPTASDATASPAAPPAATSPADPTAVPPADPAADPAADPTVDSGDEPTGPTGVA